MLFFSNIVQSRVVDSPADVWLKGMSSNVMPCRLMELFALEMPDARVSREPSVQGGCMPAGCSPLLVVDAELESEALLLRYSLIVCE